jgi:hypothetical protein
VLKTPERDSLIMRALIPASCVANQNRRHKIVPMLHLISSLLVILSASMIAEKVPSAKP